MAIYVVAYDLNKETNRPNITAEVRKTDWAKLSESPYAIDTSETPEQVHERFKRHLDSNDDFYVITLTRPWTGYGPQVVIDWLQKRLVS